MYHHTVTGLSNVKSIFDYEIEQDAHIQDYYWSKIKVVGPNWYHHDMAYQATIGDYDLDCKCGYGRTVEEAKQELMEKLGW